MDDKKNARQVALGRVVGDASRWPALLGLRPDGDPPNGSHDVTNQRRLIFDLAILAAAGDDDPPTEVIADFADPTSVYDMIAILCRELLRLRLELNELRWNEGPATN